MATFHFRLRTSRIEGRTGALYILLIHDRRSKQLATSIRLLLTEWEQHSGRIVVHDGPRAAYLKEAVVRLERIGEALRGIIARLDLGAPYTVERLAAEFESRLSGDGLFAFLRRIEQRLLAAGQHKTAASYRCVRHSIERFRKGGEVPVAAIDPAFVFAWEAWLRSGRVGRNTVSYYMRTLRAAYNQAVDGGIVAQRHPFRGIFTGNEPTRKRAVDRNVILQLKRLDLRREPALWFTRDLFLLSFYLRGMSFVDMAFLRKEDLQAGVIRYRRRKTGQLLSVRYEECMHLIVEQWAPLAEGTPFLLPIIRADNPRPVEMQYMNAMRSYNQRLHRLSHRIGLPAPLTSYVSRHTWATLARQRNIPISIISEGMGHNSEQTTRIYLAALDQSVLDSANLRVLSGL